MGESWIIPPQAGAPPRPFDRPPRTPLSLTIMFPCRNEAASVETLTREAIDVGRRIADDLEIIIVNDGSRDQTGALADALAAAHKEVAVVHRSRSEGYGAALRAGFRNATKEWVFYTDGDGQFDLRELPDVLPWLEQADIVSAYRAARRDHAGRGVLSRAFYHLVQRWLDLPVRDVSCAFKLYPRAMLERMTLQSRGAMIDAEMLTRARRMGLSIAQCPVAHRPRSAGRASGIRPFVICRAFWELAQLRRSLSRVAKVSPRLIGDPQARDAAP